MIKKLLAIIVLVTVASLSVAGCTTTNNANQTPSATSSAAPSAATQHDAFLEKYLTAYKAAKYSDTGQHVQAWKLDWINSTSARVQFTVFNISENTTVNSDGTMMVFQTTQDATNYVNGMNLTAYSLASTEYTGSVFQNATGHTPQVYREYTYTEGSILNISQYVVHGITQGDNIVYVQTAKYLS
jgi:type IV pilus biogenesis protein CpaD/CtpE